MLNIPNILAFIRFLLAPVIFYLLVNRDSVFLINIHYTWLDYIAAFLFVALVNVEPHAQLTENTIVVSNEAMMSSTSTADEVFSTEVQSFDTADDYLLLSSLEF